MDHDSTGFGGFGDADPISQTTQTDASDIVSGFGGDAPATGRTGAHVPHEGFGVDAPPTEPSNGIGDEQDAAAPADGIGDEQDAPDDATDAPAAEHGLRAEGMHADDMQTIVDVLDEHEVDVGVGQALLDKVLPQIAARRDEQWQALTEAWVTEKVAMNARPRVDAAMAVLDPATREALRGEVFVEHPTLYRVLAEFGAFVQKATRQDTVVNGSPPSSAPASRFAANDTSSRAFAGGGGF